MMVDASCTNKELVGEAGSSTAPAQGLRGKFAPFLSPSSDLFVADNRATSPLSIAMVGTRGVPARYGGFETCVEEVGSRLAERGHHVRVYCRAATQQATQSSLNYKGMSLVTFGAVRRRSLETLSHTALSVLHLARNSTDVAVVFNAANAPLLPVLKAARIPTATHVDGLEWQRAKWGKVGGRYYRQAERLAVKWSDKLIADAQGIQNYYWSKYSAQTDLISYGAPAGSCDTDRLAEVGMVPGGYHLVVSRFEPENHVDMIVRGYRDSSAQLPLVVVGSAPYADDYTRLVHSLADDRVRFLGGVWDQTLLDQLYANAHTYLHGHSVGGTNPSLLRALGAGTATTAYDVSFNREVLGDSGLYFGTAAQVSLLMQQSENDSECTELRGKLAAERALDYDWDEVALRYEQLCWDLKNTFPQRSNFDKKTLYAPSGSELDSP